MKKRNNKTFKAYSNLLKEDRDWDFGYLLDLEELKLKRMLKYFKKSRIIDTTFIIREISLCLQCIEIIKEKDKPFNDYLDYNFSSLHKNNPRNFEDYYPYVNIRNEERFFREKVIKEEIEDKEPYRGEEGRKHRIESLKVSLRQRKALHLYHLIREYKMESWWD
jgi:hypothetical protein